MPKKTTRKKPGPKPRVHTEPVKSFMVREIPVSLIGRLKACAALRGISQQQMVEELLKAGLEHWES